MIQKTMIKGEKMKAKSQFKKEKALWNKSVYLITASPSDEPGPEKSE